MNTQYTKSLAGTGKDYVVAQVRTNTSDGNIHIQVGGPADNRTYGFAVDVKKDSVYGLADYVDSLTPDAESLATSKFTYFKAQLTTIGYNGMVHLQINNDYSAYGINRRDYGGAFTFNCPTLAAYVKRMLDAKPELDKVAAQKASQESAETVRKLNRDAMEQAMKDFEHLLGAFGVGKQAEEQPVEDTKDTTGTDEVEEEVTFESIKELLHKHVNHTVMVGAVVEGLSELAKMLPEREEELLGIADNVLDVVLR